MNQNQKEKVLVLGAGISGINAGKLLTEVGRPVILYDGNKEKNEAELREQLGNPSDLRLFWESLRTRYLPQVYV